MADTSSPSVDTNPHSSTTATPHPAHFSPPSSILIIGSGVFGLSTAYALAQRDVFSKTSITVVDRASAPSNDASQAQQPVFPARDAASIDTSRIIRADYADPAYAALATEALRQWRTADSPDALGAEGRYSESGFILVADGAPEPLDKLPQPPSSAAGADDHGGAAASSLQQHEAKKTGMDYVRASWENIVALSARDPELAARIRVLPDRDAIRAAAGTGGASGTWGYVNGYAGWADADKSMAWLYERVRRTGRVEFVPGTVSGLEHASGDDDDDAVVTGARLADGRTLSADLVILAAGAWTASLLDLSGRATATGQVLGYMDITPEEQAQLGQMPVLLNLTTGLFILPPRNGVLKVARHAYGYLNPVELTAATSSPATAPPGRGPVSLPRTALTVPAAHAIPAEGADGLRSALREMLPSHPQLHERPFASTRLCWYMDTPTGDFLITYHPRHSRRPGRGLFVATGDSGHAFKFLPVLGGAIADAVEGRTPAEFADKWAWTDGLGGDVVVTEDGSRGGEPGLVLEEELRKSGLN